MVCCICCRSLLNTVVIYCYHISGCNMWSFGYCLYTFCILFVSYVSFHYYYSYCISGCWLVADSTLDGWPKSFSVAWYWTRILGALNTYNIYIIVYIYVHLYIYIYICMYIIYTYTQHIHVYKWSKEQDIHHSFPTKLPRDVNQTWSFGLIRFTIVTYRYVTTQRNTYYPLVD